MNEFTRELAAEIPRLRRYARGLTHDRHWADDLVQDTLERALGRRWLFAGGSLRAWLFKMLYRLYLNDLARERRAAAPADAGEPATCPEPGIAMDLEKSMAQLPAEQRAVLLLVSVEDMSYQECAAILEVPVGTVMSRLARAREKLRALLSGSPAAVEPARLSRIK